MLQVHLKIIAATMFSVLLFDCAWGQETVISKRERIPITEDWRFFRYEENAEADTLFYDARPDVTAYVDERPADSRPGENRKKEEGHYALKPWILPTGNAFIKDVKKRYKRPSGSPGSKFPFVLRDFDDKDWEKVSLPHDWAISGEFYRGDRVPVGGGMGRLPVQGVGWYRKKIEIPISDQGKQIFMDIDGAMSYSMVWVNGNLVGGWPYGYMSYRLDLTPYLKIGEVNQIAIRIDNPPNSSRWYPGAGLYRKVWLVKTDPVHVNHWGTKITTPVVSSKKARIKIKTSVVNDSDSDQNIELVSKGFLIGSDGKIESKPSFSTDTIRGIIRSRDTKQILDSVELANPKLWGPPPNQTPNQYLVCSEVYSDGLLKDIKKTKIGIRSLRFDPQKGVFVNDENLKLKGANLHHDLGALGAAFNASAAKRQLLSLREAGANAIRLAHNPPDPQLLDLADSLGFLVIDEIFDNWKIGKTPLDFHLIFDDWHEQDLRAFIRRDRNHPSIIMWSYGNEVGEQYTEEEGANLSYLLNSIVKDEDLTRPTTVSMNYARAHTAFAKVPDVINLNYQGEGIRNAPAYKHLKGISVPPAFAEFHKLHPDKVLISSENAATVSSRGEYFFPVYKGRSAPVERDQGGNDDRTQVSGYELYTMEFGASPDKVFDTMDHHPYVAGGFVWSGTDYLGEPTPYYSSKNSYSGIFDLAGFKKDRFYLYQSYWRPDFPMAHILPHWNWPERIGDTVPVHVFTSGDEAELFLNGQSLGKKKKGDGDYRLRWDDVIYSPGELKVIAYKEGKKWAEDKIRTTGKAKRLRMTADKPSISTKGDDLLFIVVDVVDELNQVVPKSNNEISFSIEGPGEIIGIDNGDSSDLTSFSSLKRRAFNGKALVIVRPKKNEKGSIHVKGKSNGLSDGGIKVNLK